MQCNTHTRCVYAAGISKNVVLPLTTSKKNYSWIVFFPNWIKHYVYVVHIKIITHFQTRIQKCVEPNPDQRRTNKSWKAFHSTDPDNTTLFMPINAHNKARPLNVQRSVGQTTSKWPLTLSLNIRILVWRLSRCVKFLIR